VHIRYLQGCIADWYAFFREAYKSLAPGGWLESHEASPNVFSDDDTLPPTSAIAQWGPLFVDGGKAIGRSFTIVDEDIQRKAMEEAGFVDIQEKLIKVCLFLSLGHYLSSVHVHVDGMNYTDFMDYDRSRAAAGRRIPSREKLGFSRSTRSRRTLRALFCS
jgi:hypothetical protein